MPTLVLSWGERVVYWVIILALLALLFLYRRATLPVAIFVNGEPVAWVSNHQLAKRAVELALRDLKKRYGEDADFAEPVETGNLPLHSSANLSSPSEAAKFLLAKVSPAKWAWVIKVKGEVVAAVRSKEEADQTLELVKAHLTPKDVTLVKPPHFKEKVEIQRGKIAVREIIADAETAAQKLISGLEPPQYHIVKAGEVATKIARRYGLTLQELQQLNPRKDLDMLKIGDKLLVKRGKPFLTVVCLYQVVKREPIPYKVERRFVPQLPGGALVTQSRGKEGLKEVVLEITAENMAEVKRKVVKERTIKEPVTEVILVGGGLR